MNDYIKTLRQQIGTQPILCVGAGVIVYRDNQVLLQKRKDNGAWGYHGGAVELGECVEEAAARELFEETGITADKLDLFGVFSGPEFHYTYPNGDEVYIVDIVYSCSNFHGELRHQAEEITELRWFPLTELPEPLSPPIIPALRRFAEEYDKLLSKD